MALLKKTDHDGFEEKKTARKRALLILLALSLLLSCSAAFAGEARLTGSLGNQPAGEQPAAPAGETAYCAVLGVRPGASLAIIKKAWHAQALKFHPDKMAHLGPEFVALAEQKTKAINAAYSYFAERRKTAP